MSQYSRIIRTLLAGLLVLLGFLWIILSVIDLLMGGTLLGPSHLLTVIERVILGLVAVAIGWLVADRV